MTAAAKLKKARETLDRRVVKYIKQWGRSGCRLMNLACNHGTKKQQCHIPDLVWEDSFRRSKKEIGDYSRREMIMSASIKRLKRRGLIYCIHTGTPSWAVVPEDERTFRFDG